MKKIIALLIFVCAGAALFAQNVRVSLGGGGYFTANWNAATMNSEWTDYFKNDKVSYYNSYLVGGGIYGFFDATYIEANLGVLLGGQKNEQYPPGSSTDDQKGFEVTAFKIGIFGKYPFELGGSVSVFPMLGLDIMLPLGGKMWGRDLDNKDLKDEVNSLIDKYKNKNPKDVFNNMFTQVWLKLGVGADFYATEHIFVRPEVMWGFRMFNNDMEKDLFIGSFKTDDPKNQKPAKSIFGHGLDIRLAVGYRF